MSTDTKQQIHVKTALNIGFLKTLILTLCTLMYHCEKVQKYALNSQLQALQILTNDDEVEI